MATRAASRAHYVSKAQLKRLVDSARAAGIDFAGVEMAPDGTVRLLPPAASPANDFDRWKDQL